MHRELQLVTPTQDSRVDTPRKCDAEKCHEVAMYGSERDGFWCDSHYWSQGDNPYAGFGERFY